MKRISEYFGSGQRSSGTIRSSLSATSRTADMASMTVVWTYLAAPMSESFSGWLRFASSSSKIRSVSASTRPEVSWVRRAMPVPPLTLSSVASQRIAAGRSIVRAIEAAVSASMLIVVMYCSTATS